MIHIAENIQGLGELANRPSWQPLASSLLRDCPSKMVFMHFISQADDQWGNGSQEGWWQKQMQVPAVRNRMARPLCFTITAGAPFLFEILLFQPLSSFYEAILLPWSYSHSMTCGFLLKSVQSSYWTNPSKSEIIFAPADINHFCVFFSPKKTVHVHIYLIKPHCVFCKTSCNQ